MRCTAVWSTLVLVLTACGDTGNCRMVGVGPSAVGFDFSSVAASHPGALTAELCIAKSCETHVVSAGKHVMTAVPETHGQAADSDPSLG